MLKKLQYTFALSEQGTRDLVKATIACTLTDIILMLPVGLIYLLLRELLPALTEGSVPTPSLEFYLSACLGVLILITLAEYHQYNATYLASYTESASLRIRLAEKLRRLPLSFFGKRDLSDLTTTIMSDAAGLEQAFSHFIPQLFGAVIALLLAAVCLFVFDWRLALALLWVVPVAFIILILGKRRITTVNRRNQEKVLARADAIQEYLETIRDIKAANQSRRCLKQLDDQLAKGERYQIKSELTTGVIVTSAQMLLKVGIATVVLVGAMLLVQGNVDLLTFLVFLIAATRVFDPIDNALINTAAIFATLLQIERMRAIETYPVQSGEGDIPCHGYDIVFDHVNFAYNTGETVLQDVSFTAKQGDVTALVGPSGSGKSTAARLAARFWDVDSGRITLGGADIRQADPEALLTHYAIVFQDVLLFNSTVMENIRIGRRDATDAEVLAAAQAAQCDEFVHRLPDGYQTIIGENGANLSGGERQRLSIARALLKDAPVILLDEATASLDVENETLVQTALTRLIRGRTVLVIAHRMRTIQNADKIIVLKDGLVAEQGTPQALLAQNGLFAHMIALQQQSADWQV